jgi:hypothetical protein
MHTRDCPICNKSLPYKSYSAWYMANKKNTSCKSCSLKSAYMNGNVPDKSGCNNPMFGTTVTSRIMDKWGDDGIDKVNQWKKKHSEKMTGEGNISFGKIRGSAGRSFKGWYKTLFFRSSYELAFIIQYEQTNHCLPKSAEHIKILLQSGRRYAPDFLCEYTNTIFEIKPKVFIKANSHKFDAGRNYCKHIDWKYTVVTENELLLLPKELQRPKWIIDLVSQGVVELTVKTYQRVFGG